MRIISGTARGTNLYTLQGLETRPTLDRVKESLFNIINEKIYDSTVLDLFSGSGAIGLECASRGAKKVYMCDASKNAIEIINKNITKTHLQEKVKVFNCDYKKCLNDMKDIKFDIIYLDPPYKTDYIKNSVEIILKLSLKNENGIIIVETDEQEKIKNSLQEYDLHIYDERKYGRAYLLFLK